MSVPKRERKRKTKEKNKKTFENSLDKLKKIWYNKDVPKGTKAKLKKFAPTALV